MNANNDKGGITYRHIPQGNKVIATLDGVGPNVGNVIDKLVYNNSKYLDTKWGDICRNLSLNDTYRATAKANTKEGDVYDAKKGEEVSYAKVMVKYHSAMDKKLRMFLTDIRGLAAAVEHYMTRHGISYEEVETVEYIKKSRFGSWSKYWD